VQPMRLNSASLTTLKKRSAKHMSSANDRISKGWRMPTSITLSPDEFAVAHKLGLGNVSLGIRVALDWAQPYADAHEVKARAEKDAKEYALKQKRAAFRARKDKREKRAWMREQYGDSRSRA
jgi:hypothetical protein